MIVRVGCFLLLATSTLSLCSACRGKAWSLAQINESKMNDAKDHRPVHLDRLAESAVQQEMAVYDYHFVPHGTRLSATGVTRVDRLARILSRHGGTVHYATDTTDKGLIEARLASVKEYLAATGCDMDKVRLSAGYAQSTWYFASEGVEKMQAGTADPANATAAPPVGSAAPPPPGGP